MKTILLAAVGLLAVGAAPALAADLPVKAKPVPVVPVWNWSGFYIGFNGGGASSHDCWSLTNIRGVATSIADGCHDASGGVVGGQIGYRWQWASNWVFGVEAQGDWAGLKGQGFGLLGAPVPGVTLNNQTKIDALGLFTGQIGYAFNGWATNSVLLYLKGGAAVVDDRYNGNIPLLLTNIDTARETRWGGTVGAGVELGFAPGWSVAIEYDHIFTGTNNQTFTFSPAANALGLVGTSRGESIRQDIDMATARVNYTFNWGGPVVAKY
jgi:outer membrane immunogenic protein